MLECGHNLSSYFSALSLQPRQTGLIDLVNMKWNSPECQTAQEFKNLYCSRMDKMETKFNSFKENELTPISKIMQEKVPYAIRGVIKRIEHQRIRAFEKNYTQKYSKDSPLYNELDQIQIQDKTGTIKLYITQVTTIDPPICQVLLRTDLPSGVCVILKGTFRQHSNTFNVQQILLPDLPPQVTYSSNFCNSDGVNFRDKKILIVSEPTHEQCLKIKQIINNCCAQSANITALIIIGGLNLKAEEILRMSQFVNEIKDYIDVFIMPSSGHERHQLFPLRPYHNIFFSKSHSEIGLCSNPQLFETQNGLKMHISCGQNIKDFLKNSTLPKNQVEVMELMLYFSHYCPTSPFSLKTQPYCQDHLIVEEMPHIMICGKAKTFESKVASFRGNKSVLLVSIPENKMVLVGLNEFWVKQLM